MRDEASPRGLTAFLLRGVPAVPPRGVPERLAPRGVVCFGEDDLGVPACGITSGRRRKPEKHERFGGVVPSLFRSGSSPA